MKMLRVWASLALCLGMVVGAVGQSAEDGGAAWRNDLATRRAELVKRNGPGTDAALHAKLMAMGQEDQAARGAGMGHPMYTAKTAEVDRRLTAELKEMVARHGWPTIALVGLDASDDAMTVLTHTPDHAWQRAELPELETLAKRGKIDGSALAVVVDKELVSEGRPQRYGTQFKVVDGKMAMIAVEDPEGLDARRAMVFLMPIRVYEEMLEKRYQLPVSSQVVPAK